MNPMEEVMRYRKMQAKVWALDAQKHDQDRALAQLALGNKTRVTRAVAHALLLGSPWLWDGRSVSVVGKSVGAGVWELSMEVEK